MKEVVMTSEGFKKLQEELEYLKTEGRDQAAEKIRIARGFGDLSENSEYDEAKNEQGRLYSRMAEVEEILANCVVIEEEEAEGDYIRMGSTVTVFDKEFEEEQTFRITGSQEADPMNGLISEESPFGKALMGRVEGEEIVVDAPSGPVEYKILKVEH
jgi:transcription elongation factor GreA